MNGLLLDTHALIWYMARPENLSLKAVTAIENALENNNKLYISVITIIEIIYLVEKRKIPGKGLEMLMRNIRTP